MRKYHLYFVLRDKNGQELSREIVGGGKWQPMTHAEAITARSKFTIPPAYTIELVEVQ